MPRERGESEHRGGRVAARVRDEVGVADRLAVALRQAIDRVADELIALSRSNIRGIAFSMVNYLEELPLFRDEVLPRLERAGVREKR